MRILGAVFAGLVTLLLVGVVAGFLVFRHFEQDLPDYRQLADYDPPTVTRVLAGDGRLLAEYAKEKRVFVPIGAIPQLVKDAFLSAEDKTLYPPRHRLRRTRARAVDQSDQLRLGSPSGRSLDHHPAGR